VCLLPPVHPVTREDVAILDNWLTAQLAGADKQFTSELHTSPGACMPCARGVSLTVLHSNGLTDSAAATVHPRYGLSRVSEASQRSLRGARRGAMRNNTEFSAQTMHTAPSAGLAQLKGSF
jgi:hypothetical protein